MRSADCRQPNATARSGFSLLEMLLYLGVAAIVLVAATAFAADFLISRSKSVAYQETSNNARLALARLAIEVREADGVNVGDSIFGSNAGRLSLAVSNPADNPTVFDVVGGVLRVQQGAGPALALTSSQVNVSEFLVENLSTSGRTKTFRLHLKVDYVSDLGQYQASTVLETTAHLKKGDGFSD